MKMKKWYETEVAGKKMCVECVEVATIQTKRCPKCLCSTFYLLARLIPVKQIDQIINDTAEAIIEKRKSIIGSKKSSKTEQQIISQDRSSLKIDDQNR